MTSKIIHIFAVIISLASLLLFTGRLITDGEMDSAALMGMIIGIGILVAEVRFLNQEL